MARPALAAPGADPEGKEPLSALARTPVAVLMSRRLVTVGMDDSLDLVRKLLRRHDIHHLPVIDSGRLVGIISDRDLLRALSPALGTASETTRDAATLHKRAHQVMSRQLVTVAPEATVAAAVKLLVARKLSCLPVCAPEQQLLGLLSWRDLARHLDSLFGVAAPD